MTEYSALAEDFDQSIEEFSAYTGMIVLSFAKHGSSLRETIARNFVARGMNCTRSICTVWKAGCEQDAWILYRSLLDRLFHLRHLSDSDSFEAFEEHSFRAIYEARQRLLSDAELRTRASEQVKEHQRNSQARYDALSQHARRWKRPKPETVAKEMGLGFLYRFGYDYASMHVHPMANDGETDALALAAPYEPVKSIDATVVLNSVLVQTLIVQEALNVSKLRWRAITYKFVEQLRNYLETGQSDFRFTLLQIVNAWPEMELCEKE